MRSVEVTGPTVEEAVEKALQQLGVGRADAEIEILAAPAKGIFRLFGQRHAKVRLTVQRSRAEWSRDFVQRVANVLVADALVTLQEKSNSIAVNIQGGELGLLIGRHGHTLNALQDLANAAAPREEGDRRPIVVDAEGYRQRRREVVEREALRAVQKVQRSGRSVALPPMTAAERKLIHMVLKDNRAVRTESAGREPFRRVIVLPAGGGKAAGGRSRTRGRWHNRPRGRGGSRPTGRRGSGRYPGRPQGRHSDGKKANHDGAANFGSSDKKESRHNDNYRAQT